jgi:hypothetical protein
VCVAVNPVVVVGRGVVFLFYVAGNGFLFLERFFYVLVRFANLGECRQCLQFYGYF